MTDELATTRSEEPNRPELAAAERFAELAMDDELALEDELALARERIANLETALQTNRQIAMAIGILMARHGVTEQDAFNELRTASQKGQVKLRDVAVHVVQTGELPGRS